MRQVTVILIVVVVLASACSGESSNASTSPPEGPTTTGAAAPGVTGADTIATTTAPGASGTAASLGAPCSFVTDAEMSDILGKDVTGQASGDLLCVYMPADVGSGGIELLLQDVSDVGCELIFSVGGFEDEEPVDGLGTYAMYKTSGVAQMAVCFDEKVTLTTTLYAEPADPKAALSAVAAAVEQGLS